MPIPSGKGQNIGGVDKAELENTELDSLYMPENVTIENINGESFDDFLKSICFKNKDCRIPGDVKIIGVRFLIDNINIIEMTIIYLLPLF